MNSVPAGWGLGAVAVALLAGLLVACDPAAPVPDGGSPPTDAGSCTGLEAPLRLPGEAHSERAVERGPGASCAGTLELDEDRIVELWVDGAGTLAVPDHGEDGYLGPMRLSAGDHALTLSGGDGPATLHVRDLGPPPGEITIARSLTWTDAALLDDPEVVGLDRVMRTAADGHGGPLLDAWFRRFATTAHSERLGPQRILEDVASSQGDDPAAWDLDGFPFVVTGVHNRIDLAGETHCGELRVSLASTHPLHQPFHLIALYRQVPAEADLRPDGTAHCAATALRWARLSELDEPAFRVAARAWLDEAMTHANLLVLETVEFIISPWEWRQWFLEPNPDPATRGALPEVLENRPLFQTADTPRLNASGPDRDAFLAWVADNATALNDRRAEIPERFRARSARVNDGVPWIPLDLSGLPGEVSSAYPTLRQQIELVGCPACHATDADFVQTLPDRTFSPFYDKELDARAVYLRALAEGEAQPPPHGPLQADPVLPP